MVKRKLIDGDYYFFYGTRANINEAKDTVNRLRKDGKQARRIKKTIYIRARYER